MKKAIMKLKDKKSTGHDGICKEMIKASTPCLTDLLTNTFNLFLSKSQIPKSWCIGVTSPIHKKGSKSDPNNYRGICVGNSLLKTLCILLNERLQSFTKQQITICKNQISFQKKRRTIDHILTLKTLINKHVKYKSKQKVHAAFIDFAKAFDTVWHKGLFHKLQRNRIVGNFLHLIKDMYQKTECAVKIGSQHTSFFKCPRGVRQGCPLSPTFFNIYINDLAEKMNDANNTPPPKFR